ncbi:biogenesis protein MshI [Alteromonas facilis]|uniref:biogenesis protein MshI n=1 Tax=Alteromonas facilis TaxID=2048004 RepID=UPI000C2814A9|nr:biogenesis protein MshI [Alteromonas facilis]
MRIGWRQYIRSKLQRKSQYDAVGISLSEDTASFCALKQTKDGIAVKLYHETPIGKWQQALSQWAADNGIGAARCSVSLSSHLYEILQVEKPTVPDAELRQALTWSVKELTKGNVENPVFDYFDPPTKSSGVDQVNVAVIEHQHLEAVIKATVNAGLTLERVSVEELSICDVLPFSDEPVLTLLQKAGEEIQLYIIKRGQLYFSRTLKGFENLGSFSVDELQMGVMDSLTVQIQRSMDYFESQLRQAPVRKVLFNIEAANSHAIGEQIADIMRVDAAPFELPVTIADSISTGVTYQCIGGALPLIRGEHSEGQAA